MTRRFLVSLSALLAGAATPTGADAQPIGTFRWQLRPYCNVVTVAITQNGAVYRIEGTDDQCGNGADAASVTGTAFPNADGTIGFGLNIVTSPGGRPVTVDAKIALGTFSGTWRDSAGAAGTFVFTPGAGSGGSARPLPAAVPSTIQMRADGAFVAGGTGTGGAIPASGPGARMMWYPGKVSFRVGQSTGSSWDDTNIGFRSVAFGADTVASGIGSTAMGGTTTASGPASTAMGAGTRASGGTSTAIGFETTASGAHSTSLGSRTLASGDKSLAVGSETVASGASSLAGGVLSVADGDQSLAFGNGARATGSSSVALGTNALAAGNGSFVFAGSHPGQFAALGGNEFNVRASGGVQFFSNGSATVGVALVPGAAQWSALSDARTKHHFHDLDGDDVLRKIAAMPITEWSYKEQDHSIRHIGPTAQDFHAAFGLGEDPLRIGTLDADGVALAGVKAVEARSRSLRERHEALQLRVAALERALAEALEVVRAQQPPGR